MKEEQVLLPPDLPLAMSPELDRVTVRGGDVRLIWNESNLALYRLDRGAPKGRNIEIANTEFARFATQTRFEINAEGASVRGLAGGEGVLKTPYRFNVNGKQVDARRLKALVRPGAAPRIDLQDSYGRTLFYVDRIMFEFLDDGSIFSIRSADIRIAPALAKMIGNADAADQPVGEWQSAMPVESRIGGSRPKSCAAPNWPGTQVVGQPDGTKYQADVFMFSFTSALMRCSNCSAGEPGSCTTVSGCGAGTTHVIYAPSSTLANSRNRGTPIANVTGDPLGTSTALYGADVPWYQKFTGASAPYNNDQHPYLIWNLYRLDTVDGVERLTQVGRSQAKHAFLTTNVDPYAGDPCDDCGAWGNHILGKSCGDTYGTGNNDSSSDLGPRSEIVAATGVWGRCGSIYDPDCNGASNASGNTSHTNRMRVPVGELTPVSATTRYLFESWYIVREDINIYNTMASRSVVPTTSSISNSGSQGFLLGPVIDRWVDPNSTDPMETNRGLTSADTNGEGHVKVAMKVKDLGGGLWRYEVAVANMDFSRAEVVIGNGPGTNQVPRVISNNGFNRIRIPHAGATITDISYRDGDALRADWTTNLTSDALEFVAPNADASLNWGVMTNITFTADRPPSSGDVTLGVTRDGSGQGLPNSYDVASFGVGLPTMFSDGFE
ncbi:hypothetical protein C7S18_07760 [Ahniella affigens]|uniref:Uncharacterized protein n=1 Tax=Ahniella affigens TaxID=2021234 RepID=A0A2P1PQH7_9GAMM|nr:hypothetical protein C7S18_07760 [Ahniella affigens]